MLFICDDEYIEYIFFRKFIIEIFIYVIMLPDIWNLF